MLGLFRRAHTSGVGSRGRVFLRLEALEWREQPDATPLGDPPTGDPVLIAPNAAPVIVNFSAREIVNGLFLIQGKVIDEAPGGLVVRFGGGTSANGLTVTTTADGTFSEIVQLRVDGTDSGFLTATTTDTQGLVSAAVQVFLDPSPV